jgi:hypothetical protein
MMEEVVRAQISQCCHNMGIIPSSQHGFQSGKSAVTTLGAATHDCKAGNESNWRLAACFFDLFAVIDVDVVVGKMAIYGCD